MARVRSGDRGGPRQGQPHRLSNRGHGGGRAHRHAMPVRPRDAAFHADPFLGRDRARAAFIPELPRIRARAKRPARVIAAQHRAGGQEDKRHARADRAHGQPRRGFVTAAHQHHAIERMRADRLFGLHRDHIAIEHRGRLGETFVNRDRGDLQPQPAGLRDSLFHVLRAVAEMEVAGVHLGPSVQDADHRAAFPIFGAQTHLHHARPMPKAAQIVGGKPARAAQLIGGFLGLGHGILAS